MRIRAALALLSAVLCVVAGTPVVAAAGTAGAPVRDGDRQGAGAPYAFTTREVQIPVGDPDLYGDPVVLDARVLVPVGEGPFAGLLVNHGYLGDKGGDGATAEKAARAGYIVLRYSSRGFGETKGQVGLVGPQETRDMLTALDWLNDPANVPIWTDHIGHYGGSYGGAHDFALAVANHPAVRALVPAATWTDLYDGLAPNGVLKLAYLTGFYAAGRERTDGYNNYDPQIDASYAKTLSGVDRDGVQEFLRTRSVAGKWDAIRTPMFVVQGLNDGLFDGNMGITAFTELQQRGVPVRLYLGGIGHPPARSGGGEEIAHVEAEVIDFLDHHVRDVDNGIDTATPVEVAVTRYFGNPDFAAGPAGVRTRVLGAAGYPFGTPTELHLCGGTMPGQGTLSATPCPSALPVLLAAGTGGDPTSEPVAGALLGREFENFFGRPFPSAATPVDSVDLDGPVLTEATTYAGIPTLDLQVLSDPPSTGLGGPTAPTDSFQIVPKVYDVAPDGTETLITRGAYAEAPGAGAPGVHAATFDAFAMAWTFPAGHRVRLRLASADFPYLRPNATAFQVAVLPGSTVSLPGADLATLPVRGAEVDAPVAVVPESPVAVLLPLVALVGAGAVLARRRRAGSAGALAG